MHSDCCFKNRYKYKIHRVKGLAPPYFYDNIKIRDEDLAFKLCISHSSDNGIFGISANNARKNLKLVLNSKLVSS